MHVVVHYYAQVKKATGVASESFTLDDGATIGQLVRCAVDKHGDGVRSLLMNGAGELRDSVLLFVGDEQATWQSRRQLRDGDEVTLLSPMAGGAHG